MSLAFGAPLGPGADGAEVPKAAAPPPLVWKSMRATAYDPHCTGCSGRTADGTRADARLGIIAVDPKVIPMGSRFLIKFPDDHCATYTARDTGGAVRGRMIDILFATRGEAVRFGTRDVLMSLIDDLEPTHEQRLLAGCKN